MMIYWNVQNKCQHCPVNEKEKYNCHMADKVFKNLIYEIRELPKNITFRLKKYRTLEEKSNKSFTEDL